MSDHVFYAKGKNRGNHRKLVISNPQMLIGKAPTKSKRIKMKFTMGLSTQKTTGTPEWISAAHEFVAKNHDAVTPKVDLRGFDISFSTENLFHPLGILAAKCQMRSFIISEMGEAEAPDIMLTFTVYTAFSTSLWDWLGQMAGDDVWARFDQIETPEEEEDEDQLSLTSEDDEDEEEEDEEEDENGDE